MKVLQGFNNSPPIIKFVPTAQERIALIIKDAKHRIFLWIFEKVEEFIKIESQKSHKIWLRDSESINKL